MHGIQEKLLSIVQVCLSLPRATYQTSSLSCQHNPVYATPASSFLFVVSIRTRFFLRHMHVSPTLCSRLRCRPYALPTHTHTPRRERAQIGQDLFSGQAAVPLQFPASFTFVFRAFTTLDGIGKTLDKGYDLTKIAGPFLKELLDLKDGNAYVSVLKGWQKKLGELRRRYRAAGGCFTVR